MMGSKKHLVKTLILGMALLSLTGCGGGEKKPAPAESKSAGNIVQVKSEKSVDLIPLAKKEGSVKVYSITSRISKAGAAFEKKYGIKVEATNMKDFELIDKISTEVKAKAAGADFVIAQDSGRVYGELLSTGYLQNYVPADLAASIPKENQSPLVFVYMNKVLLYNNENGKASPVTNIWQLTETKNKGRFFFKNPMQEGINANFLTMLTKPEIAEKLAKSYEDLYHKKLKLTTKNAGYEWIKMAFSNGLVMGSSDTSMTEALGVKGQNINNIGLLNYSKIRYAQKKNLAVGVADKVAPFCGFYYPEYALLVKDCKHPAAAKLFIQFLLTEEGYKYWQSDMGSYSGNPKLKGAKGDKPIADWAKVMVGDDPKYIFENRAEVEEFLSKLI
jgi:iron(III) transport system substrate-binding protein